MHHYMLPDFFWQATNEADHPVGGVERVQPYPIRLVNWFMSK